MDDPWSLGFALSAGILLGAIFFGGLWWTVRKALASKRPASWFLGSLLVRLGVVLLGFYLILGDSWQKLLAGLLGFMVARLVVLRLTRLTGKNGRLDREYGHAP